MPPNTTRSSDAFTLIEMLVVISIIAVLMGLAFPAFQGVQNAAKKTQAKNDLVQIVTAVNAFYTEYGQYPAPPSTGNDSTDYFAADNDQNKMLMDKLRAEPGNSTALAANPRMVQFLQPRIAKDSSKPTSGIGGNGRFYDPWNSCYRVRIDTNYSGALENPYSSNAGFPEIVLGVAAWSTGKDKLGATDKKNGADKNVGNSADDIISWQ